MHNPSFERAMPTDDLLRKWTPIDGVALARIQECSPSTGIHSLDASVLPSQIQRMPGAVSYFVCAYPTPVRIGNNETIAAGELAVVRKDAELWKAYNYVIASSGDGRVYFNGPYKHFAEHHFTSTSDVSLESLFGHIPRTTSGSL